MNNKNIVLFVLLLAVSACQSVSGSLKTVDVYRHDGSVQCEGAGMTPEAMQKELDGIRVLAARKDHLRGIAFPAVCGGGTSNINVYTIPADQFNQAKQRGFEKLPEVSNYM